MNINIHIADCGLRIAEAIRRTTHDVRRITILFFGLCFLVSSCAMSYDGRGRYHRVMKGETLAFIAKSYSVSVQDTAELNNIDNPRNIEVGEKIYLPDKRKRAGFKKLPFGKYLESSPKKRSFRRRSKYARKTPRYDNKIKVDHGRFIWPLNGRFTSPFGIRNGRRHDGIDIAAKTGTPIKAAGSGKVVFSGKMRGYGNLVIVRHKGDFFTVYAHNSRNLVKKGNSVKRGQRIAKVGRTGRATGPHLHFEVRNGQKARNPLFFLPRKHTGKRFAHK